MAGAATIALLLMIVLALSGQGYAYPSDLSENAGTTVSTATSTAPITATTSPAKEIKEIKDIKEAATASKDLKDVMKAGKEARKNKKDCIRDWCTDYDPICVHDPADPKFKPRTFGSPCVLESYNCENGTKLAMKSKGECPGSTGVKL